MARDLTSDLTPTELKVLCMIHDGATKQEIDRAMGWANRNTFVNRLGHIKAKMEYKTGLSDVQTLVRAWVEWLDRPIEVAPEPCEPPIDPDIMFWDTKLPENRAKRAAA